MSIHHACQRAVLRRSARSRTLVLFLGLVAGPAVVAQSPPPFAPLESAIPIGLNTKPLGFGDVNGDGAPDLIVLGPPFTYFNDGHGRFAAAVGASGYTAPTPSQFRIVDLNGDGRADLVFIAPVGATSIWFGTPSGSFTSQSLPPGFASIVSVAVGDVNGDGAPDLICGTTVPNPSGLPATLPGPTTVYLNNGLGAFAAVGALGLPNIGNAGVAFADIDQDGDQDMVFAYGGFVPNLGGIFGVPVGNLTTPLGSTDVAIAHFNADPYPDVLATGGGGQQMWVGGPLGIAPLGASISNVIPFDLDGNGTDELVEIVSPNTLNFRAVGPGGIGASVLSLRNQIGAVFGVDLDGDGDRDLVVFDGGASVYLNDGGGGLHYVGPALSPLTLLAGPVVADVDNDGHPDLVGTIFDGAIPRVAVARNDGLGRFSWTLPPFSSSGIASTSSIICPTDLNGNGSVDLGVFELISLFSGFSNILFRPFINTGGTWTTGPIVALGPGGQYTDGAAVDLNGDGVNELVFADGLNGVRVFTVAAGTIAMPGIQIATGLFSGIAVGDVNGDGLPDLALAGNPPRLLINGGNLTFTPDVAFPTQMARYVTLGDVNGDGVLDCYLDNRLFVHVGGAWTHVGDVDTGYASATVPVQTLSFDFDGDGDIDTACGSGRLFVNTAPGVVTTFTSAFQGPVKLARADLDGDGDLDLVGSSVPIPSGTSVGIGAGFVLFNTARQLTVDAPARPGRPTHLGLRGAPNGSYLLFGAPGLGALAVPPFGTVLIDPGTAILLATGSLGPAAIADASMLLPASVSAYVGVEVDVQAVVDTLVGPRLTNGRRVVIENW